jgi:hypothetical protein
MKIEVIEAHSLSKLARKYLYPESEGQFLRQVASEHTVRLYYYRQMIS